MVVAPLRAPFHLPRRFAQACCVVALMLQGLTPGALRALSLDQYFFELSDRERGAYITGFLDLFVRDSARDAGYRSCVEALGPARLHQTLAQMVEKDPSFLSYDAMSWLLYEASRLCNQKAPRERPGPPVAQAAGGPPASEPSVARLPPPSIATPEPSAPPPRNNGVSPASGADLLLASLVALACAGAVAIYFFRSRWRWMKALAIHLTRRDRRRSAHSPE